MENSTSWLQTFWIFNKLDLALALALAAIHIGSHKQGAFPSM